jgi:deoxyadenosine/deoxycytidine kinase
MDDIMHCTHLTSSFLLPLLLIIAIMQSNSNNRRPYVITVEGNIGSGKSTLLDQLKAAFADNAAVRFISEPVDQWNTIVDHRTGQTMLQRFYAYPQQYAFEFQMMALLSRITLMHQLTNATNDHDSDNDSNNSNGSSPIIYISERSVHTDRHVFAQMMRDIDHISDTGFQIYDRWFNEFIRDIHYDQVVYIHTSPSECMARVKHRQRPGEENITPQYLEECDQYHGDLLAEWQRLNVPILMLDGHPDLTDERRLEQVSSLITAAIQQHQLTAEQKEPPNQFVQLQTFMHEHGRMPNLTSTNPLEHQLAQYATEQLS